MAATNLTHRVVKDVVRKRFDVESYEEKRDMMASFIRHGLNRTEAVAEAVLQMWVSFTPYPDRLVLTGDSVAGTETTATTIRSTMLYIMTNPHLYMRLQSEIDSTTCQGRIISDQQARTLPYLQAVIREGARMCPPATGILCKKTPPEGDTIHGKFIPGGVDIGQCILAVERSKEVFGEDSFLFRPERWLEADEEKLERMEKSLALVWGYGKYSCVGKNIAFLELNKVFFEVCRHHGPLKRHG